MASDLHRNCFNLINQKTTFGEDINWTFADNGPLWAFHLHYMDYLWAADFECARRIVLNWINRNPYGAGTGWHPYVIAQRLLNWVLLFRIRWRELTESDAAFSDKLIESVFSQFCFLANYPERDLLANHLYKEATGLMVTALALRSIAVDSLRVRAERLLIKESREQFLSDGGHYERSPMYHAISLVDLIHCLNLIPDVDFWDMLAPIAERGIRWLRAMSAPDGSLFRFGDSTGGAIPSLDAIFNYAELVLCQANNTHVRVSDSKCSEVNVSSKSSRSEIAHLIVEKLTASGFYVVRSDRIVFAANMGDILCDYQPGHAHGDIFSFVLYIDGMPIIVDTGVYEYACGSMRDYSRTTSSHNTVEIAGRDQHEFWASHRVGRRAHVYDVHCGKTDETVVLTGYHDGYRHLSGKPLHHREYRISANSIQVSDKVQSASAVSCISRIHLYPQCQVEVISGNAVEIRGRDKRRIVKLCAQSDISVEEGWYFPEFGKRERSKVLVLRGKRIDTEWREELVIELSPAISSLKKGLPVCGQRAGRWESNAGN